jgi:phage N-6-adenine-methyltransferase
MVQSELVERFDTAVAPLMDADEAHAAESEIIQTGDRFRVLLVAFYDRQGYRALGYSSYTSWAEAIAPRVFGMSRRRLTQELAAAVIERELGTIVPNSEVIPESHLRPLSVFIDHPRGPGADEKPVEVDGEAIRAAWDEVNNRTSGKPTTRVVKEVVREMRADSDDELDPPMEPAQAADIREAERKPRVNAGMYSSATPEWYTPRHIIDRVEKVFGQIDLDPCSNSNDPDEAAVPATDYWTKDDNGITQEWRGKVYMNPPYGDEIATWVGRLIGAYEDGEIVEGIALLPARTDTAWFQSLADYRICFVRGRLRFSQSENSAPFPSAVVYLGPDTDLFWESFRDLGFIK